MKPLEFQEKKALEIEQAITEALSSSSTRVIVFQAPTGAGKTLIVTEAIKKILNDAAFIWMSYYPDINNQSSAGLKKYNIPAQNIEEISAEAGIGHLERGTIYFVNFQKLAGGNRLEQGGDTVTPFRTLLQQAKATNLPVVAIIDEAHFGSNSKRVENSASTILETILASPEYPLTCVLGVTATPDKFNALLSKISGHPNNTLGSTITLPKVTHETVKAEKLLKHDLDITTAKSQDLQAINIPHTICRNALKKWKTIRNRWRDYDESIYPLLIVQVPDKYDDEDTQFLQAFREMYEEETGKSITPDEMRHCFSGDKTKWDLEYISPQDIQDSPQIQVVFFKSALTTGWDCPRAEMLISLRSAKDKTSIVQLVGRMLRNPRGFQVGDPSEPDLDVAFLYLPFYDQNILDDIEKEYKEGLTGKIRTNTERVELTWNPDLLDKKEEILEFLNGLLSAQKVWKGKNMPSRVKELREALISAPLKKENVDTAKLSEMLTDWLSQLTTEVVNISSLHLQKIKGKAKLDGVELETLRRDNPIIKKEVVDLDPRDEKRCFQKLEEKIPKLRDGVTEDILRDANRTLKESSDKNPDGLRFPILILHAKGRLTEILQSAMKECLPSLQKIVEQITKELSQSDSQPRREMRALANSLLDIDSTVEYKEWECPETQTAYKGNDWVQGKKCIHTYEGLVPPGSGPELKYREYLENDSNVLAYLRNPQKGNGLAVRYKDEDGLDQVTYPDFLIIEKYGSNLQLKIAECKGGEERTPEPDKYKGLVQYEKMYRKLNRDVTTLWVEYIDNQCFVARPTMTSYDDRLGQPNLIA